MSLATIREALETALNALTPSLATAFENLAYTPVPRTAYQRVTLLPATPENPSIGAPHRRERGILQIDLAYPADNSGSQTALARAVATQSHFARGSTFTREGVTVVIPATPNIGVGYMEKDRYIIPVRVPYYADIFA